MPCSDALAAPPPLSPDVETQLFVVAACLIDRDGRVLATQRPAGKWMAGQWEFPGGKVEAGEVPEFALMRELREELGIESRPSCFSPLAFASHYYADKKTHVLMPLYALRMWEGTPRAEEGQGMKWCTPAELYRLDFVAADLPLLPMIEAAL